MVHATFTQNLSFAISYGRTFDAIDKWISLFFFVFIFVQQKTLLPAKFALSNDKNFLLLTQNVRKVYRYTFLAQYTLFDIHTRWVRRFLLLLLLLPFLLGTSQDCLASQVKYRSSYLFTRWIYCLVRFFLLFGFWWFCQCTKLTQEWNVRMHQHQIDAAIQFKTIINNNIDVTNGEWSKCSSGGVQFSQ